MKSQWPHFTVEELACKHCGNMMMADEFMKKIEWLRMDCGFPFIVGSAYRCPEYNQLVSPSGLDGPHTTGRAMDIVLYGKRGLTLLDAMFMSGDFTGLGISQKGDQAKRFIHLDDLPNSIKDARPWIWSY